MVATNGLVQENMKEHFKVGEEVTCLRGTNFGKNKEHGKVIGVSDYLVIVEFAATKESYTYFDYRTGKVTKS